MKPKTPREQNVKQFDQALFDQIAQTYARKDRVPSSALARSYQVQAALKRIGKSTANLGTLVDVGCGIGQIAIQLKGQYQQYIGIDHSEKMIAFAKSYHQSENRHFYADDVGAIDALTQTADVVFARGFLHHVDDLDRIMSGLKKIAKPGAYFVAIEPNNGNAFIQLLRKIRKIIDPHYSSMQHYFSSSELMDLLDRSNMKEANIIYHGYVSPPFAEVIFYPQFLFTPLAKLSVLIDEMILRLTPKFLRSLSWNLIVCAKFPEDEN